MKQINMNSLVMLYKCISRSVSIKLCYVPYVRIANNGLLGPPHCKIQ
jgi:hypothetical protein